jgi:hypothetical protein
MDLLNLFSFSHEDVANLVLALSMAAVGAVTIKKVKNEAFKIIRMTPAEWAKVPANPIQRRTAWRIKSKSKSDHLRVFKSTHAILHMAKDPKGNCWKLDGHTRDRMWQDGETDVVPMSLQVVIVPVANEAEAEEKFDEYDSPVAVKNVADRVFGLFKKLRISMQSKFFASGTRLGTPLRYAFEVFNASTDAKHRILTRDADTEDHVATFIDALSELDVIEPKSSKFGGPLLTAYLLAYTKYGDSVLPFFMALNDGDKGHKKGALMDPVMAVEHMFLKRKEKSSGAARAEHMQCVAKVLGALESYREGKFDEPGYQPKINIKQIVSVDLDCYLTEKNTRRTGRTKAPRDITR